MIRPNYLAPKEYADDRRISLSTVYRLCKAGGLGAERIGRQWRIPVNPSRHLRARSPRVPHQLKGTVSCG